MRTFLLLVYHAPHPTLTDILLKFQEQLHQLTPNTLA
jgi:hypothetical protein